MRSDTIEDYKKLRKEIDAGSFRPVYLLHGEEGYFIDRLAEEIERRALQEHERDFNLTILYGRDCDPDQIKDACVRYPMMAERQVVILREAQTWRIDAFDKLETYFKNPTPTTILVIAYKHKKADGRKNFVKEIGKRGAVFTSDKLREEKLPDWIRSYVTRHMGRQIGMREAQLLADHLGSDLGKVTGEAEKLCLVTEPGGTITADLIQRMVGISKEYNVFELQNALGARDRVKAQRIAHHLAHDREHKLFLTVGLLNSFFAKLALVHASPGLGQQDLAAVLKVPPFFVKDYMAQARNFQPQQLRGIQHHLALADLRSKGVGNDSATDGELLQELVERVVG